VENDSSRLTSLPPQHPIKELVDPTVLVDPRAFFSEAVGGWTGWFVMGVDAFRRLPRG
jgi:hypothetical protein